jgi:LmbE family N-acetylglucosaminyl deacetylase
MDHQVASLLTMRAYVAHKRQFPIYFFEVDSGSQTMGFSPTQYVDISQVRDRKKAALFAHKSQHGEEIRSTAGLFAAPGEADPDDSARSPWS